MRKTRLSTKNALTGLLVITLIAVASNTLIHPALAQEPTIYLVPSDNVYDETTPVGTKFNVTVWVENVTDDLGGANIYLEFDDSIINVTRWWAPDWDPDFFMPTTPPVTTLPTPPDAGYIHLEEGRGYVKVAVSKGGLPPTAPWGHNGSIAMFEFNITKGPPPELDSILKINTVDTYLLDSEGAEVPGVVKEDGSYTIIPEFLPIIALSMFIASTAMVVLLRKKGIVQKPNKI